MCTKGRQALSQDETERMPRRGLSGLKRKVGGWATTPGTGERMICRYPAASLVPTCNGLAHLGAGTNVGGLSFATQAVSGALGVARNDANTCCAQGDATVTKWPIPAN